MFGKMRFCETQSRYRNLNPTFLWVFPRKIRKTAHETHKSTLYRVFQSFRIILWNAVTFVNSLKFPAKNRYLMFFWLLFTFLIEFRFQSNFCLYEVLRWNWLERVKWINKRGKSWFWGFVANILICLFEFLKALWNMQRK